jgi:hypothetical protein
MAGKATSSHPSPLAEPHPVVPGCPHLPVGFFMLRRPQASPRPQGRTGGAEKRLLLGVSPGNNSSQQRPLAMSAPPFLTGAPKYPGANTTTLSNWRKTQGVVSKYHLFCPPIPRSS